MTMNSYDNYFGRTAEEARRYARDYNMVIATREELMLGQAMFVVRFMHRWGDTLYETGGMARTEDEAITRAYRAWRNYWRGKGESPFA